MIKTSAIKGRISIPESLSIAFAVVFRFCPLNVLTSFAFF